MLRFRTLSLAFALAAALIGCGGGGSSGRSSSTAAAVSTATATPTTSGSTAAPTTSSSTPTGPAAPTFGGQIAALGTANPAVSATLTKNHFAAFRESSSISDLVVPDVAGLRDRGFVVEDKGSIRILDLSGATPRLDRQLPLTATPLPPGITTGGLAIVDARTALVTTSGRGGEGVYVFDPSTARVAADVKYLDLSSLTVRWPAGTRNSKGADIGGLARPLTFTAGALIVGNRLLIASSNLDASFDNDPGTVLAFDWNPNTRAATGGFIHQTSRFNPTALTRVVTPQGEAVLVTNTGPFGTGPASIDVLDGVSLNLVGSIQLGAKSPSGPIVVSPDGRRGYVGSAASAEVFALDLENLGAELRNTSARDLSARYLGGFDLPSSAASNFVSGLGLSHTGSYLYATNFNTSELWVVDLHQKAVAARVTGFARTGSTSAYQGLANKLAVRPGVPGRDFQGPSVLVMTIGLAAADRTIQNVTVALDAVTVDRH